MTASTPPLVDVIAEANKAHEPEFDMAGDCYTGYCSCGQSIPYSGHAAHQARAVLDALTKAGCVEWGTEYGPNDVEVSDSRQRAELFSKNHGDRPTVSRFTGPWTAER